MGDLTAGDLEIVAVQQEGALRLEWHGKSVERQPAKTLVPYFVGVLGEAAQAGKPVEMHFETLEHFNSSTITALIQIIQEARSRGVRMVFVYNQALKWQKLSFDALRVFTKDGFLDLKSV